MPKPPEEWTEDDLLSLVRDVVEERSDLEYKRCAALKRDDKCKGDISKDVSALANSAGGVIVYGMVETGHIPSGLDAGFDPADITKEWLEQVILGNIRPRLNGIVINPVNLASHSPGKVAYVVVVPQSHTAHQASDKKYYKRFNFVANPMEDYEIRDIMNRLKHPLLVPQFKLHRMNSTGTITTFTLEVILRNDGNVRVSDFKVVFEIPQSMNAHIRVFGTKSINRPSRIFGNSWQELSVATRDHVIFPNDELSLTELGTVVMIGVDTTRIDLHEGREPFVFWKAYADDMPAMNGETFLQDLLPP